MPTLSNEDAIEWGQKKIQAALARLLSRIMNAKDINDITPNNAFEELWLRQLKSDDPSIVRSAFREMNETAYGKAGIREKARNKGDGQVVVSFRSSKKQIEEPPIAS